MPSLCNTPDPYKSNLFLKQVQYKFASGGISPDPDRITADEWAYLFNLPSKHQRQKHLSYLYNRQARSCSEDVEKATRKEIINRKRDIIIEKQKQNKHIVYGLGHNFLYGRITRQTMARWMNLR